MRSSHPWPFFPVDPQLPIARSLVLQFILQEFIAVCDKSPIDRLCFYCDDLVQATQDSEIPMILEEIRHSLATRKPIETHLRHFFNHFSAYLKECRSDESLLLYLIEHKGKLNAFLGARAVETLLQSFFPAGHAQLRAVIYEGFTRRGFSSFFDKVEPLVNALEW